MKKILSAGFISASIWTFLYPQVVRAEFDLGADGDHAVIFSWHYRINEYDRTVESHDLMNSTDLQSEGGELAPGEGVSYNDPVYTVGSVDYEYEAILDWSYEVALDWEDFDEPAYAPGDWNYSEWTPSASEYFEDEQVVQTRNRSRYQRRGKRANWNEQVYYKDDETYLNYEEETQTVWGTKPR